MSSGIDELDFSFSKLIDFQAKSPWEFRLFLQNRAKSFTNFLCYCAGVLLIDIEDGVGH